MAIPSYTKTTWENGTTPINEDNLNNIENQLESITDAKDTATATGTSLTLNDSVYDAAVIKSNSKNLFDKDTAPIQAWIFDTTNMKIVASANGKSTYIPCKANTTYTISRIADIRFQIATTEEIPNTGVDVANYGENNTGTTMRITTGVSAKYLVVYYWHNSSSITEQAVLDTLQIEEGDTATSYNPYNTKVIITDGDVSSPIIEAGTIQQANGQNATGSRMRSAGYINVEPNKEYTLNVDGNTAVVFEYKSDNTYIHRIPDNWIETPYTFTATSETAKVRFVTESPNVTQDQIAFQEGSQSQKITLTPQEEKLAYTYNTKTGILSDGSVTITYNKQARVLNNDDMQVAEILQQHIDYNAKNISKDINIIEDNVTLGSLPETLGCINLGRWLEDKDINDLPVGYTCYYEANDTHMPAHAPINGCRTYCFRGYGNTGAKVQVSLRYNNDDVFIRHWWSNAWSPWINVNQGRFESGEVRIGRWIDAKPIYRKVINFGALPNNTTKNVAHGISNIGDVVKFEGVMASGNYRYPIPQTTSGGRVSIWLGGNNVSIQTTADFSSYSAKVVLEYTKSTD